MAGASKFTSECSCKQAKIYLQQRSMIGALQQHHHYYDPYCGVIVYFRVIDGSLCRGESEYQVDEIGVLSPSQMPVQQLYAGERWGMSIRSVADARVGDTITSSPRKHEKGASWISSGNSNGFLCIDADQQSKIASSFLIIRCLTGGICVVCNSRWHMVQGKVIGGWKAGKLGKII
ncbi:hypothetical protein SELMODRAFT_417941 [Selaginella moellendorffii]|uniref:Translation elongation factor EFTu-like domain-containing protein n=1 Tax=Selaginella moellendorffii TaxID=88036 RepID=D8S458_SELML|nr:hypothetical protein SELMODRAFT_417941 [Selaginella moellendorffii]